MLHLLWTDIDEDALPVTARRDVVPERYRTLRLDAWALQQTLGAALLEDDAAALASGPVLSLPLPDGGFGRFQIAESPIMEPGRQRIRRRSADQIGLHAREQPRRGR